MRLELKAAILAAGVSLGSLALTFAFASAIRAASPMVAEAHQAGPSQINKLQALTNPNRGRSLYDRNCAHCHGDDARGDEGPTLYDLAMSDARISTRVKDGIKGEMPGFKSKLNNQDIADLTAFLRTLKD